MNVTTALMRTTVTRNKVYKIIYNSFLDLAKHVSLDAFRVAFNHLSGLRLPTSCMYIAIIELYIFHILFLPLFVVNNYEKQCLKQLNLKEV